MLNRARRRVGLPDRGGDCAHWCCVAWRVALQAAEKAIRAALGPEAVIGSIDITPGAVTIENLVLPGRPAGPRGRRSLPSAFARCRIGRWFQRAIAVIKGRYRGRGLGGLAYGSWQRGGA